MYIPATVLVAKSVLPLYNAVPIVQLPIAPEVAVKAPETAAPVANKTPALVTLNGALPKVALPK